MEFSDCSLNKESRFHNSFINYILKVNYYRESQQETSLHCSRMRTARSLTVSPSMLCTGGVSPPGGVCSGGCLLLGVGGVSAPWWGLLQGVCVCSGGRIPACTEADTPPC